MNGTVRTTNSDLLVEVDYVHAPSHGPAIDESRTSANTGSSPGCGSIITIIGLIGYADAVSLDGSTNYPCLASCMMVEPAEQRSQVRYDLSLV